MPEHSENEPSATPITIERNGESSIRIRWSDGSECEWTVERLRKACPCASCREKKRGALGQEEGQSDEQDAAESPKPSMLLPVLSAAEAQPLRIEAMRPVGSYAYSIAFSDGHSSGIFPMALLYDADSV